MQLLVQLSFQSMLSQNDSPKSCHFFADECFSGPDEGRFDEDGDAEPTKCLDDSLNTCSKTSQYCSGTDHTNYVYTVITSGHKGIIRIE